MEQYDRQFWHIARSFLIRYNEYNRQKGGTPVQLEEFEHTQAKLLAQHDLKEVVITKLAGFQLKCDYHNLIMLAFFQDLAKWSKQYQHELKQYSAPLECLITQTIQILNSQQQYHTIVAKQNQLIATLLPLTYTQNNLEHFKVLYRKLKDVKDYLPAAVRQHQKKCFISTVEETIEQAKKHKNIRVIEYIFANIFNQLQSLPQSHEYVSARLKILKRIVKGIWILHQEILYKLTYLLMKYSYHMPDNLHLCANILPIYEPLLDKLLQKPNIAALLLYKHIVMNNLELTIKGKLSYILFQGLLSQVCNLFVHKRLEYFMRNYDWDYLQIGICQQTLSMLYQYTQNRSFQKKPEYELIKVYLNRIHHQIKQYLQDLKSVRKDDNKWKFYQVKKKQYLQLIQEMNQKPKNIFKRIQSINNADIKQATIQKYVKMIKKTAHLQNRTMIDVFSTDNKTSAELFTAYTELILKQCKQHNLQQFIRLFTSNFFIAGQSQQIARVMDTITQLYFNRQQKNNIILKSSDATYTFANAILILNTDLHNPKNQQKISQQNFLKMCKKINQGEDIPVQILKKTYSNVKKNKINTFRDRGNMIGISVSNWMLICTDYQSKPLTYYDQELQALDQNCFKFFVKDVLTSILDQKQTSKLQLLVQRFIYEDKVFECQIIQIMRKIIDKKPHLPTHILQKIFEFANFKNSKVSQKLLSYYWLAAQIITTFPTLISTNLSCQFLVTTWSLRIQLQDNMYLRQSAQIKRIKECIKTINKRQSKKSIMDMFSNFLSFKESDDQKQILPNDWNRRVNFKSISNNVLDIIKYNNQHRKLAIVFLMTQIHKEQSKLYEEFVSCLFLTFNLLYLTQSCQEVAEDLFYELLGLKQSQITKRLDALGKKDTNLYNILINYCRFWILKLLLKDYTPKKLEIKQNNNFQYLLNKSLQLIDKADKQVLQDLVKELLSKNWIHAHIYQTVSNCINKIYKNGNIAQVQTFIQKFKNKEATKEQPKQQNKDKNENSKTKTKTKQIQHLSSRHNQPLIIQNKQIKISPINQNVQKVQSIKQEQNVAEEQEKMKKKKSIQNLDAYLDPDAMIDQIQRQIQQKNSKKTELKPSEQDTQKQKQYQKQAIVSQIKEQIDSKEPEMIVKQEKGKDSQKVQATHPENSEKTQQEQNNRVILF